MPAAARKQVLEARRRLLAHVDDGPYAIIGGWGSVLPATKRTHLRLLVSVLGSASGTGNEPEAWVRSANVIRDAVGPALRDDLTGRLAGWAHTIPAQVRDDVLLLLDDLDELLRQG